LLENLGGERDKKRKKKNDWQRVLPHQVGDARIFQMPS
jgi:hypothetical protein